MTLGKLLDRSCERCNELSLQAARGRLLRDEEQRFVEAHRRECDACAQDAILGALLAFDGTSGAAAPLDELAERRWTSHVLALADSADETETDADAKDGLGGDSAQMRREHRERWSRVRLALWVTLPVAAALAAVLVVPALLRPSSPEPRAAALDARAALVTCTAGRARSGQQALAAGARLALGASIEVQEGRAVLSLSRDIAAVLAGGSSATLVESDAERVGIRLEAGMLVIAEQPPIVGPRLYVETRDGRVDVVGTLFSVGASEGETVVRVAQGAVLACEGDAATVGTGKHARILEVKAGEKARLGSDDVEALTLAEAESVRDLAAIPGVVGAVEVARLSVVTSPAGADVSIDGVSLGPSPASFTLSTGQHWLEVTLSDHAPVRERLDVKAGESGSRAFDLVPLARPPLTSIEAARAEPDVAPPVAVSPAGDTASAAQLLAEAQALRTARSWSLAARAYRRILEQYPGTPVARAGLVSLAEIELEHLGAPAAALARVSEYLRLEPAGSLVQEAMLTKAAALARLSRYTEERGVLESFARQFPEALEIDEVRQRLRELATPTGESGGAEHDEHAPR